MELNGNKVSDDYLKQVNDLLNRNKSGEIIIRKIEESPYRKTFEREHLAIIPSNIDYKQIGLGISPSKKAKIEHDIEDEKFRIKESKAGIAKELEIETTKR